MNEGMKENFTSMCQAGDCMINDCTLLRLSYYRIVLYNLTRGTP